MLNMYLCNYVVIIIVMGRDDVQVFNILEQLGSGAFGQVYKANNRLTGQMVAVKQITMVNIVYLTWFVAIV